MKCPKCGNEMQDNHPGDFAPEYGWWDECKLYCPTDHLFMHDETSTSYVQPSGRGFAISKHIQFEDEQ